jgi:hypothetical protein
MRKAKFHKMRQFKILLLSLLVSLAFLFNIERLDIGQESVLNIETFVYFLALFITITILLLPVFSRHRVSLTIAFAIALYLICKLFLFGNRPFLNESHIYVTATETALLAIVAFTAQRLSQQLAKFQQGFEMMTITLNSKHLQTVTKAASDIRRELTRSRHYHRPLSVIVVEPDRHSFAHSLPRIIEEMQKAAENRFARVKLAQTMEKHLRLMDLILEEDSGSNHFIILCPEVDREGSAVIVGRIEAVMNQLGIAVQCRIATFPEDALTFEGLVNQAKAKLRDSDETTIETMPGFDAHLVS